MWLYETEKQITYESIIMLEQQDYWRNRYRLCLQDIANTPTETNEKTQFTSGNAACRQNSPYMAISPAVPILKTNMITKT